MLNDLISNKVIGKMLKIKNLKINFNNFENIDFVNDLIDLEILEASNNKLKSFSLTHNSSKMYNLTLSDNFLNQVNVQNQNNLQYLYLSNNFVHKFKH